MSHDVIHVCRASVARWCRYVMPGHRFRLRKRVFVSLEIFHRTIASPVTMPSFTSIISHGNSEKLVTHLLSSWTTTIYGRESTCPSSSVSSTSSEHVLVPAMLACSAKKLNHVELPGLHFTVKLCVDRQRPLEHLAPRRLLKSVS